ncbi:MAG: RNA polymerase sigma factor [Eubacterium sp.]
MDRINYTEIVEKYANNIYRVALSYCKNKYDAEDVLQNVFLKLLQSDVEFEGEEHLRRWLIRVTVNCSKDLCKSFWKKRMVSIDEAGQNYSHEFSSDEKGNLYDAVMDLPGKYRIVTHLYYYEDYSVKEIADILTIKETTVQTQLMRARNKLQMKLKEVGQYDW